MRKLEKLISYAATTIAVMMFLLLADIAILSYIARDDMKHDIYAGHLKQAICREKDGNGNTVYSLAKEGEDYLDGYNAFAFFMDKSGKVLWEYRMPDELPKQYAIEDALRFSRWYLMDYPVYTHILDDLIIVVGLQKGTTWKYTLTYSIKTMEAYVYAFPAMIAANVFVLAAATFFLVRHDQKRREKERTTWIAGVSHDIRTPLSLVIGYADEILHLADKSGLSENQADILKRAQVIEEQAVRIRDLVINLNMENKLTYGMGNWKKEQILLPALIRDTVCEILNRRMDEKYDIRVIIAEELEQFKIKGDKELIKRLIENLINNSIKHNSQGCEIEVVLARQKKSVFMETLIKALPAPNLPRNNIPFCKAAFSFTNTYALEISDNGQGASKEQLKRFNRLFKSDKLPEHGLGIRLVRQIAAFHHWRVRFYTKKDGGFCCQIKI